MEKLNTKNLFLEGLKDLIAVEREARDRYKSDVLTFKNFSITQTMGKIRVDEERHIRLLAELIAMLEK